jgi:hypothetical protein
LVFYEGLDNITSSDVEHDSCSKLVSGAPLAESTLGGKDAATSHCYAGPVEPSDGEETGRTSNATEVHENQTAKPSKTAKPGTLAPESTSGGKDASCAVLDVQEVGR